MISSTASFAPFKASRPKDACEPVSGTKSPTRVASKSAGGCGSCRGSGVGVSSTLLGVKDCGGAPSCCVEARACGGDSATSGDEVAATSGDEVAATSGDEVAATSGGEVAATSGGEVAATSGGEAAATSGGEAAATSGGEAAATSGGEAAATSEGEAAVSGGGTGACSGGTGACRRAAGCCGVEGCSGACSGRTRCCSATGCCSAGADGFLLQPVKAKATLKKTSNREVGFTGRSLGNLWTGATELCTRGSTEGATRACPQLAQNSVNLTHLLEIPILP